MSLNEAGPIEAEVCQLRERVARMEQEAADRGRRESEERFRHIADAAPVMLWMSGSETLCTFFNRPWLEYRGGTLEQELGDTGPRESIRMTWSVACKSIHRASKRARNFGWSIDFSAPTANTDGLVFDYRVEA